MDYEIILKEITTETKPQFDKDTNTLREVTVEKEKYLFHVRVGGYKPNLPKALIDFAVEQMQ